MWIRAAYWIGKPKVGFEKIFRNAINHEMVSAFSKIAGVSNVKALWPERLEGSPPQIACEFLVEFESRDDLDGMLNSRERIAFRPRVLELIEMFDGSVHHIDFEVGPRPLEFFPFACS